MNQAGLGAKCSLERTPESMLRLLGMFHTHILREGVRVVSGCLFMRLQAIWYARRSGVTWTGKGGACCGPLVMSF